ncbi:conserved hypothetical protein [Catenulispora acidiphila DSM 44928]|uniref:DUF2254 domain-containing protein n=1 Tax=Catenulispora acidiphila (strain DSM 44928 / JCM 14897 / NBRC 102108 / NRRL B-24433 / ID139908) TaxID=479433 RepID=C7PXY9_CATAD|nr:conserved hypothetical protein [Catenulispora acidiphila DSM 44928]
MRSARIALLALVSGQGAALTHVELRPGWRREALRTSLWWVPTLEVGAAFLLFWGGYLLDRAAYNGTLKLPSWVISGNADASRQILAALAAAVITVIGVVFSVILVALTLAANQLGPRMLRNFMRDRGTQWTLGTFVGTFTFAILVLISIGPGKHGDFVPHASISAVLFLALVDVFILIYFIHHIAVQIQLPYVIASIASDVVKAIEGEAAPPAGGPKLGPTPQEILATLKDEHGVVTASESGYLQYVSHSKLVRIATEADAVIHLLYRPGHFIVAGRLLATVTPPDAAPHVKEALRRAHLNGPYRSLTQDISFGIDQLVEIAVRALSQAVNDPFTALTCIDWIGDSLRQVALRWHPQVVHRDRAGYVRLIRTQASYDRLVRRGFEKVRQASGGVPSVMIRELQALKEIMAQAPRVEQYAVLREQADMIKTSAEQSIPEPRDLADVVSVYDELVALHERLLRETGD